MVENLSETNRAYLYKAIRPREIGEIVVSPDGFVVGYKTKTEDMLCLVTAQGDIVKWLCD